MYEALFFQRFLKRYFQLILKR